MAVDWARIKERDREIRISRPEMFDKPPEGLYGFEVNPDLTENELDDAFFWKDYMRGVWLVTGPPGSGKDVLVNMVAYKMKHFFGLTPILDYKPCAPFGYYEFFDTKLFVTEVQKIANAAKVQVHDSQNKDESYNLIEDMALSDFTAAVIACDSLEAVQSVMVEIASSTTIQDKHKTTLRTVCKEHLQTLRGDK